MIISYLHFMRVYRQFYGLFFFFFKQKTAYEMRISDWSSDVCSSDLFGSSATGFSAARVGHFQLATRTDFIRLFTGSGKARTADWMAVPEMSRNAPSMTAKRSAGLRIDQLQTTTSHASAVAPGMARSCAAGVARVCQKRSAVAVRDSSAGAAQGTSAALSLPARQTLNASPRKAGKGRTPQGGV